MNEEEKEQVSPKQAATPPELPVEASREPIGGRVSALIEGLLKYQPQLAGELKDGKRSVFMKLLLVALGCLAVFGLVVGTFSMGTQLWAAPLKVSLGLFAAGLLCFPSLYIFSCLSGAEVRLGGLAGVLAGALCLTGLLLIGFVPVVWVFSQSTESVAFIGGLLLIVWVIALWFGMSFLKRSVSTYGAASKGHLSVWVIIFALVTFQMMTSLRPIVGASEDLFDPEKKFFLQHWFESMVEDGGDGWQKNESR